jgi:uncharacterized membrane protein YjjP (DUF1212 family)
MIELIILIAIGVFIILYRNYSGDNVGKYLSDQVGNSLDRYAPYSFRVVREKTKQLGQEFTPRQYLTQIVAFGLAAGIISYLYFYSIITSLVYIGAAILVIPYLAYLRCKRVYSEFIFEQIQVYTTNTIMEFATTQSFVKALEGVYSSGVLEDPVKADVKLMIDMAYENGTINQSLEYMNEKYDYYMVRNMHQLFLQITNEGAKDTAESLENMSQDIDALVENVYRDRLDRAQFHSKFVQFGIILYFMCMLLQFMLGKEKYADLLKLWYVKLLIHTILIVNSGFLVSGEKYYNENVGAE